MNQFATMKRQLLVDILSSVNGELPGRSEFTKFSNGLQGFISGKLQEILDSEPPFVSCGQFHMQVAEGTFATFVYGVATDFESNGALPFMNISWCYYVDVYSFKTDSTSRVKAKLMYDIMFQDSDICKYFSNRVDATRSTCAEDARDLCNYIRVARDQNGVMRNSVSLGYVARVAPLISVAMQKIDPVRAHDFRVVAA